MGDNPGDSQKPRHQRPQVEGGNLAQPWTSETAPRQGKPKGAVSLLAAVKRQLRENPDELEALAENLIRQGKREGRAGNVALKALGMLLDRLDGAVERGGQAETTDQAPPMRTVIEQQRKDDDEEDGNE